MLEIMIIFALEPSFLYFTSYSTNNWQVFLDFTSFDSNIEHLVSCVFFRGLIFLPLKAIPGCLCLWLSYFTILKGSTFFIKFYNGRHFFITSSIVPCALSLKSLVPLLWFLQIVAFLPNKSWLTSWICLVAGAKSDCRT